MTFARDIDGYLRSRGVTCGWEAFWSEVTRRAHAAKLNEPLSLGHPLVREVLADMQDKRR